MSNIERGIGFVIDWRKASIGAVKAAVERREAGEAPPVVEPVAAEAGESQNDEPIG